MRYLIAIASWTFSTLVCGFVANWLSPGGHPPSAFLVIPIGLLGGITQCILTTMPEYRQWSVAYRSLILGNVIVIPLGGLILIAAPDIGSKLFGVTCVAIPVYIVSTISTALASRS